MSSDTLAPEPTEAAKPEFDRDSTANTIKVAVQLCLLCSVIVSLCAVVLRPMQERNKKLYEQENILRASGLYTDGCDIADVFKKNVTARIIDLDTGSYDDEFTAEQIADFDARKQPQLEITEDDVARLKRREEKSRVYQVEKTEDGKTQKFVVLPIRGYGLWSTLYGFIALDVTDIGSGMDQISVAGLSYYKHGETPGLGGEVDNPKWKSKWPGKAVFDTDGNVLLKVAKAASGDTEVDALSGATITSKGVSNMLQYWLGSRGYGPFLNKLKNQ